MPPGEEEAAARFYSAILGLQQVAKPPELAPRGGVWFREGDLEVHLGVEEPFTPARKAHPAFLVRNLETLRARIEAAGYRVTDDVPAGGLPPLPRPRPVRQPAGAGGAVLMDLPFKRLRPEAELPAAQHDGDAGLDLRSAVEVVVGPGQRAMIPTGVAVAIPEGHAGLVLPRSGLASERGLTLANAPGLIDAGYRGEVICAVVNLDRDGKVEIGVGDRIAQLWSSSCRPCRPRGSPNCPRARAVSAGSGPPASRERPTGRNPASGDTVEGRGVPNRCSASTLFSRLGGVTWRGPRHTRGMRRGLVLLLSSRRRARLAPARLRPCRPPPTRPRRPRPLPSHRCNLPSHRSLDGRSPGTC